MPVTCTVIKGKVQNGGPVGLILNSISFISVWSYSLKINELNQSSQAGVFFFSTQLLLKIPIFELNYCFVFHRT